MKKTLDNNMDFTPEWTALKELAAGNGLNALKDPQLDASLNKKIYWFLNGGAAGVLIIIKDVFGKDALQEFYEFLNYYLSSSESDGHYHYSDVIKNKIKDTAFQMQGTEFNEYIQNLKSELIEKDKNKKKEQ